LIISAIKQERIICFISPLFVLRIEFEAFELARTHRPPFASQDLVALPPGTLQEKGGVQGVTRRDFVSSEWIIWREGGRDISWAPVSRRGHERSPRRPAIEESVAKLRISKEIHRLRLIRGVVVWPLHKPHSR